MWDRPLVWDRPLLWDRLSSRSLSMSRSARRTLHTGCGPHGGAYTREVVRTADPTQGLRSARWTLQTPSVGPASCVGPAFQPVSCPFRARPLPGGRCRSRRNRAEHALMPPVNRPNPGRCTRVATCCISAMSRSAGLPVWYCRDGRSSMPGSARRAFYGRMPATVARVGSCTQAHLSHWNGGRA